MPTSNTILFFMTKDEIRQLAERIASGIATDEEVHLYNRIYNSFQSSTGEWVEDLYGSREELEMVMKKNIWKRARIEKPFIRMKWIRWVAAAAIIAVFSTASFIIFRNRDTDTSTGTLQTQKERFKNDVAPGQEGAILTLSNGKTIVLDNADNGSLAQQGSTEVIKKNGQIVYANQGSSSEVFYNTMTTPKGRQYSLVLADGSKVWLNAASSLHFPTAFVGKERRVEISGEAYFEIAKNKSMPFIVSVNGAEIQVLGTHFNVMAYNDEDAVKTTLLEGSVKFASGNNSSLLKPGQQVQLTKERQLKVVSDVDVDEAVAWKNGMFHFEYANLGTVTRQLSRWYDVDIVNQNENIKDLFVVEMPRSSKLSDVLKVLELTANIKFEIEGKKIIVMK